MHTTRSRVYAVRLAGGAAIAVAGFAAGCGSTKTVTKTVTVTSTSTSEATPLPSVQLPPAAPVGQMVLYGHIKSLSRKSGRFEMRFDPAWWLTGVAAEVRLSKARRSRPGLGSERLLHRR